MAPVKNNTTIKKDTSAQGSIIINQLTIRPVDRSRKDIGKWRNAHTSAEISTMEIRTQLYDLYDDVCIDPVLSSLIDKRLMAVTNVELKYMKNGTEVEGLEPLLKSEEFKELLKGILLSKMWGISLLENSFNPYRVYSVPRKHIRPKAGIIAFEQFGDTGFNYREGMYLNTMLEVGKSNDFGLLLKAVPFVLYKRGCMGDWAQFTEVFGMPTKIGKYSGYDDATRIQLEKALDEAGSALSIVIPEEAKIEFLESKISQGGQDIYKSLINLCDEQLSILILGQTETTKSSESSGYAQSKTHEKTENEINKDDRSFVLSVLNSSMTTILRKAGFPVDGGEWCFEDEEENISLKDRVTIDTTLKAAGLPIDDDYFYEKYNIPKPKGYDSMKKQNPDTGDGKVPPVKKEKPVAELSVDDIEAIRRMSAFFA